MKVLFILTYYSPHWTGLTRYAIQLAEGLTPSHDITVVTTKHNASLLREENICGVRVIRSPVIGRLSRSQFSLVLFWDIIMQLVRTDRVIVFLPFVEVMFVAFFAKLFGKKFFLVHNGDLVLPKGYINRIIERCYWFMTDAALTLCHRVILYTEDYARHSSLLLRHKTKWAVVLPPFTVAPTARRQCQPAARSMRSGVRFVVGFAGRFVEEKGFDVLLAAIPLVRKKVSDVRFVFAGETHMGYESFFERHEMSVKQEDIMLMGRIDWRDMGCFYGALDVFVVSSRSDCFPSTQIEAMLSGVPVVVTDIPGARVPVERIGMGVIVPSENAEALAKGIIKVLLHRNRYARKHKKAVALFSEKRSIAEIQKIVGDAA
ncbi:glycosyltransferase family 4 protein [Candidatus Gottesmanbacteria bacterium]|nr:glycosyltransferase family 4 protein [Candidatus Gottesmanbacteria bacterium]